MGSRWWLLLLPLMILGLAYGLGGTSSQAEYDDLVKTCNQELQIKQKANQLWGIDTFDRWDLDQSAGTLVFSRGRRMRATCPVQIIGSFNTEKKTWLWSWNNPSVAASLTEDARELRTFGKKHRIEKLTEPDWSAEESDAWDMTALAVRMGDAKGAYRGPSGPLQIFMTFGEVTFSKRH